MMKCPICGYVYEDDACDICGYATPFPKAYIAGKITNDPDFYQKFATAAEELELDGCIVLNPAELPRGLTKAEYMKLCFAMIDIADVVALLPDWMDSPGACVEKAYCNYIGKPMKFLVKEEKKC